MWVCKDCRNADNFYQDATEINLVRQWSSVRIDINAQGEETDRSSNGVDDEEHYDHEEDTDEGDVMCSECDSEAEEVDEDEYDDLVSEWNGEPQQATEGKISNLKQAIDGGE